MMQEYAKTSAALHASSDGGMECKEIVDRYMKFLYPYECEKKNLSSPTELQAAIDGNRREGRRSSYGQYDTMHSPLQMQQMSRQNMSGGMQQMSPLALVTHAAANNQQAAAAAAAAAHHRLMAPNFGQVPNLMTAELEQRMMEYLKLIQVKKEQQNAAVAAAAAAAGGASSAGNGGMGHGLQHQTQHHSQRHRSQSPEMTQRDALNALEMSRVALWQMYHTTESPPASLVASPQSAAAVAAAAVALANNHSGETQRSEALNLSDSPPNVSNIKRERDRDGSPEPCDEFNNQPPAAKRPPVMPAFPGGFWPPDMAAAAAAANFHQNANHDSDMEADGEHDDGEDEGEHNTTVNSTNSLEDNNERQLNGHHHDLHHHLHNNHHLMHAHNHALLHHNNHSSLHHSDNKSDDSAIEHSTTTSGGGSASGATAAGCAAGMNTNADADGNISPVSTKKIHLSKQCKTTERHKSLPGSEKNVFDAINLFSSLQFNVKHHGLTVNGEPQLFVNLQLNGIKYSGVLLGKTPAEKSNTPTMLAKVISDVNNKSTDNNNSCLNLSDNSKPLNEDVETMKVVEEIVAARKEVAPVTIKSDANNETAVIMNNINNNKTDTINPIKEHAETMETDVESSTVSAEATTTLIQVENKNPHNNDDVDEEEEEEEEEDDDETHSHENSSRCSSPPRPVIM